MEMGSLTPRDISEGFTLAQILALHSEDVPDEVAVKNPTPEIASALWAEKRERMRRRAGGHAEAR